jgi:hypothetical protein
MILSIAYASSVPLLARSIYTTKTATINTTIYKPSRNIDGKNMLTSRIEQHAMSTHVPRVVVDTFFIF